MNRYVGYIGAILAASVAAAVLAGMSYAHASLFFGIAAALLAPLAIHRIPDSRWSLGMIGSLAAFASFPIRKEYRLDGFHEEAPVFFACFLLLWLAGLGWKRSWTREG